MAQKQVISSKHVGIEIVDRRLLTPKPGYAAPEHDYAVVFGMVRADVKTRGSSPWAQIDIDGKAVTHTFTLRYTTIPFDTRNRVRDARGILYQILKIENVDERNVELRLQTAVVGDENRKAAL